MTEKPGLGFKYRRLIEIARRLRKNQTPAEEALWQMVRNRQLAGLKFRRQHQIGRYIVDFYCVEHCLIVELDGAIHDTLEQTKIDAKRDAFLSLIGNTVIRIRNERVFEDTERVLAEIVDQAFPPVPIPGGPGGEGPT